MKNFKNKLVLFLFIITSFMSCTIYKYPQAETTTSVGVESDLFLRLQVTNHRFRLFNIYDDYHYNPWYYQDPYFGYQGFLGFNSFQYRIYSPRYIPTRPFVRPISPIQPPIIRTNPIQRPIIRYNERPIIRPNERPVYSNPNRNQQQTPIIHTMPVIKNPAPIIRQENRPRNQ